MARKEQDERFRSAMQRLSTLTSLEMGVDIDFIEKNMVANDGPNNTYKETEYQLYFKNGHGEQVIFAQGKKPKLTEQMELIIRIIEASQEIKGEFIKGPPNPG